MSKPNQEGEKHLKLDNIQFPFHPKPKTKRFSPITPQNNLKNFFPEDFFGDSSKKPIFENVDISFKKMNSDEISENKKENLISKIKGSSENNIIHIISCKIDKSSNSHSTKNSDNENINSNEFQNENFEGDIIFKETPHFFPQVVNKEKILSDKIKIQKNLIQPMDGIKVNKELKNLFDNIPENLKSDPDVNEKVGILLKNIYEMKQIIKNMKDKKNKPMTERKKKNNLITYTPTSSKKIVYQKTNVNSRYIKQ